MNAQQRNLAVRLLCAVLAAFAASMALTWLLHAHITNRERQKLFDKVFHDVGADIRERVDSRMIHQAMIARDRYYEMREEPWWNDIDESSRRLRELASELGVDEICFSDAAGHLTHSARREEVGALDFTKDTGQAHEFAALLDRETELAQPLMPNSLRGEMIKYVGVWLPDGGFVQVGGYEKSVRNVSRTAITGLTHDWHVSGEEGGIYVTTGNGMIISHPVAGREGGQWSEPDDSFYCEKRIIEGFPVYIVVPKRTAIADRRILVVTSAFLNGMALVFAAILVGIVITGYVKDRMRERQAKDMSMAKSIQWSAIPRVFPPFAEEPRLDVFASMQPAREVGGDFYDFFFTGPARFAFLIADVSGKGIPAALYMMRAKATFKGIAQTGLPLAEVAERANDALSRDNDASMFVTAWIGEVDLSTGIVTYVNPAHTPPLRLGGAASPEFVRGRSGMMFGAMPGIRYKARELMLKPGEMLYLYTDGITEQPDQKGELFGEERLRFSVDTMVKGGCAALIRGSSPLLGAVLDAVHVHGGAVEQADDCTQLIFRWNGDCTRKATTSFTRVFPPTQEGIAQASEFLDEVAGNSRGDAETRSESALCASAHLRGKALPALHVILDEIAANIVRHSKATRFELKVEFAEDPAGIRLVFTDDGVPYDPLAHADPDTTLPPEERPIGGLGVMMVKKMSDSLSYERAGGCNVLAAFKKTAVAPVRDKSPSAPYRP